MYKLAVVAGVCLVFTRREWASPLSEPQCCLPQPRARAVGSQRASPLLYKWGMRVDLQLTVGQFCFLHDMVHDDHA